MGPGEVEFRAVVEIVPGQVNDFVIPVVSGGDEEADANTLTGPWEVIWRAPLGGGSRARSVAQLRSRPAIGHRAGHGGAGRRRPGSGGALVDGRTGDPSRRRGSIDGNDLLQLRFDVGDPIADSFLAHGTARDGIRLFGWGLSAGAMGLRVVLWAQGATELAPRSMICAAGCTGPTPAAVEDRPSPSNGARRRPALCRVRSHHPPFDDRAASGCSGRRCAPTRRSPILPFALNELEHMLLIDLEPGTLRSRGGSMPNEGIFLADTITVTAGGRGKTASRSPVAGAGDRGAVEDDHGEDVAFVCVNTPAGCPVNHAESGRYR